MFAPIVIAVVITVDRFWTSHRILFNHFGYSLLTLITVLVWTKNYKIKKKESI